MSHCSKTVLIESSLNNCQISRSFAKIVLFLNLISINYLSEYAKLSHPLTMLSSVVSKPVYCAHDPSQDVLNLLLCYIGQIMCPWTFVRPTNLNVFSIGKILLTFIYFLHSLLL